MARVGLDPDPFRRGVATLDGHRIAAFLEVHIEQGPRLDAAKVPVGIVTGIRGNMRYRGCRFVGEYSHAGGVPRDLRRDALFGAVEFARRLEKRWDDAERAGLDLVCTLGEFGTDPRLHAMTKIPGEVTFTIDARSLDDALLTELDGWMRDVAAEIAVRRSLDFEIPEPRRGRSTPMDGTLVAAIEEAAGALGVATLRLASGGGHDAATFASQGVPTAMIFVRNQNGSHNPFEAMELDDFVAATAVLARTLVGLSER